MASSLQSKPTLPLDQIFGTGTSASGDIEPVQPAPFREPGQPGHGRNNRPSVTLVEGVPTYAYPDGAVPGPKPPKSWTPLFDGEERVGPLWRADAFRILLDDLDAPEWLQPGSRAVMPLTIICAQTLLKTFESEDLANVTQYIPPHLKRDLIRWHTLHRPLSNSKLYTLYSEEGHADGELFVVGPQNSLRGDVLKRKERVGAFDQRDDDGGVATRSSNGEIDDWDTPTDTPTLLTVIGLLESPLPSSVLFSFPPTLTHLALVALPHSIPVHRLPRLCPLLEVLDISFNDWLSGNDDPYPGTFDAIEWGRWGYLRRLGIRACSIGSHIVRKVNANRWIDVEVIGADDDSRSVNKTTRPRGPW